MVARLDRMDEARKIFLHQVESESRDKERLKALAHTLHEEMMQMRELCQQVVYKSAMLRKAYEGDHTRGDFKQPFDRIEEIIK
jgi:hypothetical protein